MYQASVPLFRTLLGALSKNLDKEAAFCEAKKGDPSVLVSGRLAPDMFPLSKQVQIATDMAKGAVARLAGVEIPTWEDNEKTFDELTTSVEEGLAFYHQHPAGVQAAIGKTLAHLGDQTAQAA